MAKFSRDSVKLDFLNRLLFFEQTFDFTSETKFADIEKKQGVIVAFGAYNELCFMFTRLFDYAYNTSTK